MNAHPQITVYGADWCPDCRRAKRILDEHQIPYRWVDIDRDRAGEQFVIQTNRGNRSIPTIVFPDGSILVEPSNAELSAKLG
ncbi:MAG: mycoredoxin [Anaerolineales bacterium]